MIAVGRDAGRFDNKRRRAIVVSAQARVLNGNVQRLAQGAFS